MALVRKKRRKNFLFGKKVTHSSALLKGAYEAGRKSGDTNDFGSWWSRQSHAGYTPSTILKRKAERRYRAGVESLWAEKKREQKKEAKGEAVKERKAEKEQIAEVQEEVIDALVGLKMSRSQATRLAKSKFKAGDSFNDLFRKVMAKNPKLAKRLRKVNPAKFDKCVGKVTKSLKKAKRPGNAFAICTAAGTRNPKGFHLVDSFRDKSTAAQVALKYAPYKVVQRGQKWEVWTKQKVKKANTTTKPNPVIATLKHGDAKAIVERKGLISPKYIVKISRSGSLVQEQEFAKSKGAIAYARLRLFDIASNPDAAVDLIPGGSTIDAYAKAGHRVLKGVSKAAKSGFQKAVKFVKGKKNPKRKNPLALAQQRHEEFTGFPSTETIELTQRQHVHTVLTGLAQFVAFNLQGVDGRELPPLIANGMKYDGPPGEILFSFKGSPKGDWAFDPKTPAQDITWLTASEQTERNGKEIKQQLYLSGGIKTLTDAELRYLRIEPRDLHDNTLIGTITRIWYLTKKVFEAKGKEKVWFYHDFGKEGSAGICPVLIYHPLDPSFEIAGGRYYIALPRKDIGASPGIVG